MTDWLQPAPSAEPGARFFGSTEGRRLVFNVGGYWVHYPAYGSTSEYNQALDAMIRGALLALGSDPYENRVSISMQPPGAPWIEWLLPMENWRVGDPFDPEWDSKIVEYARLFQRGVLDPSYTGVCASTYLEYALRFCADVVVRNFAPDSWLFSDIHKGVTVYFHNTSSLGVYVGNSHDSTRLVQDAERLGLEYQPPEAT